MGDTKPESPLGPEFKLLPAAAGATRMLSASTAGDDGGAGRAWVVAELGGRWMSETFERYQEAPPVLKLVDGEEDVVLATANGWILGLPSARGAMYLTDDGAELSYRLAWLTPPGEPAREPVPLQTPPGLWAVKTCLPLSAGRALVVLWRPASQGTDPTAGREQLWLASVDTASGAIVTEGLWTGTTSRRGAYTVHSGITAGADAVYIVDQAGADIPRLVALDAATFETRWTTTLEPPRPLSGQDAMLAMSGDGVRVMVAIGLGRTRSVSTEATFIVDAGTGDVSAVVNAAPLGAATQIHAMVPGRGANVVFASIIDTRSDLSLAGIFSVGAGPAEVKELFNAIDDAGGAYRKGSVPLALAQRPAGGYWVAMPFSTVGRLELGRRRPEVEGLVTTPGSWYRSGRPRIDEWIASLRR